MARGRGAKKNRAYNPRFKKIVCEIQFPDCPETPNDNDCPPCPLYKPKIIIGKSLFKEKSTETEMEVDKGVDISYKEETFDVEEPKLAETKQVEIQSKVQSTVQEEDELEKATRPD